MGSHGDCVDLDLDASWQGGDLHRGASRVGRFEETTVGHVDECEVGEVDEVDSGFYNVAEVATRRSEYGPEILHHLLDLGGWIVPHNLAGRGVERYLTAHEYEIAGSNRL